MLYWYFKDPHRCFTHLPNWNKLRNATPAYEGKAWALLFKSKVTTNKLDMFHDMLLPNSFSGRYNYVFDRYAALQETEWIEINVVSSQKGLHQQTPFITHFIVLDNWKTRSWNITLDLCVFRNLEVLISDICCTEFKDFKVKISLKFSKINKTN